MSMLKKLLFRLRKFMVKKTKNVKSIAIESVITNKQELEQYQRLCLQNQKINTLRSGYRVSR